MLGLLDFVSVDMLFTMYVRLCPKDKDSVIDYLRQFGLLQGTECIDTLRPEVPKEVF